MTYARIAKSSRYLPEFAVSNDDLSQIMETSGEWIKTGPGFPAAGSVKGKTARTAALVADRGEYMQLVKSSGEVIKTSFL